MAELIEVAAKFGVPVAVMLAMGAFFLAIARWFKPRADQLIDAHLSLVENIKACNAANADSVAKNVLALKAMSEKSICQFNAETSAQKILVKSEEQANKLLDLAANIADELIARQRAN